MPKNNKIKGIHQYSTIPDFATLGHSQTSIFSLVLQAWMQSNVVMFAY